jgi:hypothetical protein
MENNDNSMRIHLDDNIKQFISEIKINRQVYSVADMWKHIDESRYNIMIRFKNSMIVLNNCKLIHDIQASCIRIVDCDDREKLNPLVDFNNNFIITKEAILNDFVIFENVTTGQVDEIKFFKTLINNGRTEDYSDKEMYLYAFIPEAFAFPSTIDGRMLMLKYKTKPMGMIFLIDEIQRDKIKLINVKTRIQHVWSPYKFLLGSTFEEQSRYDYDCSEIIPKLEKVIPLVPYEMNKEKSL